MITAEFVRSAARLEDFPTDGLGEVALVGRSNVGKSSLINRLARARIARTSATPGKTRLANIYRVSRGGTKAFYLVDLPGYGYARAPRQARGGPSGVEGRRKAAAAEFDALARTYFGRLGQVGRVGRARQAGIIAALLLVDARHPGLASDRDAWMWLKEAVEHRGLVATKIDKLARGERIRALSELESVHGDTVLPFSAVTDEGLDELWKLIDRLVNSPNRNRRSNRPPGALLRHKKNR